MVLRDSYSKTRVANSKIIKDKITSLTNAWKAGKFMDLTLRGHSCNTYMLSKVYFKCASIPLSKSVANFITTKARKWIFQDCYIKPSNLVLLRDYNSGGIGLQSIKNRTKAMLIRTFCEQAADPRFRHSLYLESLYRQEIKGEYCGGAKIPLPPYYDKDFFETIRKFEHNDKDPSILSIKEWSCLLTKDDLTLTPTDVNSIPQLIPIRPEVKHPEINWKSTWQRSRAPGIPSDLSSFLFKILHNLLPTQERQAKLGEAKDDKCNLCLDMARDDLFHSLVECGLIRNNSEYLIGLTGRLIPGIDSKEALYLNFQPMSPQIELAASLCLATGFLSIWNSRQKFRFHSNHYIEADITARAHILQLTCKYKNVAELMLNVLKNFPP